MFSPIAIYMGDKFFRIHVTNFSGSNAGGHDKFFRILNRVPDRMQSQDSPLDRREIQGDRRSGVPFDRQDQGQ